MHLTPNGVSLLRAACVLLALTALIWAAMIVTRSLAMQRRRIAPQDAAHPGVLRDRLPSEVMRVSDNYNHLFEAPTVFYAVVLVLAVLGRALPIDVLAAWAYVLLRVAHSVVQTTFNRVTFRFVLFLLSWIALIVLIFDATLDAFTITFQ